MDIDSIHDELIVPNPFAEAILFFRGGASGEEAPIRIIQGPKTQLGYTDNAAVDPIHNEVFTAQFRSDAILVFRRDSGGDVAPIRIIHGPKTKLDRPLQISVDPVNDLIAVTTIRGLWIYNRTDNGDVAPRWIIAGPKAGLGDGDIISTPRLYPAGKKIFVAGGTKRSNEEQDTGGGRIAVWKYGDNGDIAPWAILQGTLVTKLDRPWNLAINPEAGELIIPNKGRILFFHIPELFK